MNELSCKKLAGFPLGVGVGNIPENNREDWGVGRAGEEVQHPWAMIPLGPELFLIWVLPGFSTQIGVLVMDC